MYRMSLRVNILLLLLFIGGSFGAIKAPFEKIEPLYDSSDPDLPWPPKGKDFSSTSFDDWPNQKEQFGKHWPRIKVPIIDSVPSNVTFKKKYVNQNQPVVINGLLDQMTKESQFSLKPKDLAKDGRAAITFVTTMFGFRGKKFTSLRDLILKDQQNDDEAMFATESMHRYLKTQLYFPSMINCKGLENEMIGTKYTFINSTFPGGIKKEHHNQLYCMPYGEAEFMMIKDDDWPTWDEVTPIQRREKDGFDYYQANVMKIDYKLSPQVKDIKKFHIAKITDGQCLYVPSNWIVQMNILEKGASTFEMRWRNVEYTCDKHIRFYTSLGDVGWIGEEVEQPKEKSSDRMRNTIDFFAPQIGTYILSGNDIDYEKFSKMVRTDIYYTKHLPKWNDECEVLAGRLFKTLDRNGDDVLNEKDIDGLKEKDVEPWAEIARDRQYDLLELSFDLMVDSVGGSKDKQEFVVKGEWSTIRAEEYDLDEKEKMEQKYEKSKENWQNDRANKDEL